MNNNKEYSRQFITTDMTKKALKIAYEKHNGQLDKAGMPYIFHPFTVSLGLPDEITTTIALLHDVVEDTDTTIEELETIFPKEVTEALKLLTHDKDTPYLEYVKNIKQNKYARLVKISDLNHNSDLSRLKVVTAEDIERINKYEKAKEILLSD